MKRYLINRSYNLKKEFIRLYIELYANSSLYIKTG